MKTIIINEGESVEFRGREMFKTLRTNIELTGTENRVIAITSCLPDDGKTWTSYHLAEAFAEDGKNVLLVDADLRKSVLMNRLKIKEKVRGLSHYLAGQDTLENVIYATNQKNLFIIPAGSFPPNPSGLLNNRRFRDMVAQGKAMFDYVFIDTPPLGLVVDSAVVSKYCDGSILVIASSRIRQKDAKRIKEQLAVSNDNILGVVLNKVNPMQYGRKYGYYNGGYYKKSYGGYYGSYGEQPEKR